MPKSIPLLEVRQAQLDGQSIAYTLRRSTRRSIGLKIDDSGLTLAVPRNLPEREIQRTLRERTAWILEHLHRRQQQLGQASETPEIADGLVFPLLGVDCTLRLEIGNDRRARSVWSGDGRTLTLLLSPATDCRRLLLATLQQKALDYFQPRLADTVAQLGLPLPALHLSSAKTRWGSCSSRSGIRLNWRLIHCKPLLIDYVIAHEVAHLKEMNHSPRFWAVVEQLYPGWQIARAALAVVRSPKL